MKKPNCQCIVCGKKYFYCRSCEPYDKLPNYRRIFHDENCHDIFELACDFRDEKLTCKEAYEKLGKLDLSRKNEFANGLIELLDEIINAVNENSVEKTVSLEEDENVENSEEKYIKEKSTRRVRKNVK